jgi:hypothetical protein|nr:MAG: hypothetical protein J07AB56_14230 [Candidatus Nanosalinarum sp. J07AB56]
MTVGLVSSAAAQQSDSSSVDVTVDSVADVDINPTNLDYTSNGFRNIEPGTFNATSDTNFTGIEIENSGSENLTDVRVRTTEPESRPFATGVSSNYDAGNFIQVRPQEGIGILTSPDLDGDSPETGNSDETGYHYAARVDFNASGDGLSYIKTPTTEGNADGGAVWRYGRFRSGDQEFFWAIRTSPGTSSDANICDGDSNAVIRYGNQPHTDQNIGTVDFTDDNNASYEEIQIVETSQSDPYGRVNNTDLEFGDGTIKDYSVLTYCGLSGDQITGSTPREVNDTYVVRTRYDRKPLADATRLPQTSSPLVQDDDTDPSLQNLVDTTNTEFEPGDHFTLETAIEVPRGTAVGDISQGSLSIRATT